MKRNSKTPQISGMYVDTLRVVKTAVEGRSWGRMMISRHVTLVTVHGDVCRRASLEQRGSFVPMMGNNDFVPQVLQYFFSKIDFRRSVFRGLGLVKQSPDSDLQSLDIHKGDVTILSKSSLRCDEALSTVSLTFLFHRQAF